MFLAFLQDFIAYEYILLVWSRVTDRLAPLYHARFRRNTYALISGHPGGLTPGNPRVFAPRHLQIPLPKSNIFPEKATIVPPPGEHKQKQLVHLFSAYGEVQLYTL